MTKRPVGLKKLCLIIKQFCWDIRLDDQRSHALVNLLQNHIWIVLGEDDRCIDAPVLPAFAIFDR